MIPRPPASLVGVGAEEWTRVVTLLVDRGQWDPLRSTVLLAYCEAYADWHRLSTAARGKELIKQGEKPVPNPLLPVIERAHRSVRAALEELLRPAPWAKAPAPGSSQQLVISRGHYHLRHEPCWYAVRKGRTARPGVAFRKQTSVWEIANPWNPLGGNKHEPKTGHSAQKPVECHMARPIRNAQGRTSTTRSSALAPTLIAA